VFPERAGELGGHVYIIEFANQLPTGDLLAQFETSLDKRLCVRNEDYEAHRSGGFGLKGPKVIPVPAGFFATWMKSRGKLGGQNKVPRIITNRDILAELIELTKSFESSSAAFG
jgi:hypothetical protein